MSELGRSAALLAGSLAVKDPANRRHSLLLAPKLLDHRSDTASIDAAGVNESAIFTPVEADTSAPAGLARDMLMQAASELDSALGA